MRSRPSRTRVAPIRRFRRSGKATSPTSSPGWCVHPGRGKQPLSNRTSQRDRTVLHTLFAYAEELELRDGNPVARVKAPKADPRDPVILNAEEYDRFLRECEHNPMLYLYVPTMGETGARSRSEVLQLQWPDVDLDGGFIRIRSGGSRQRTKGRGDGSR
jgi:integrase